MFATPCCDTGGADGLVLLRQNKAIAVRNGRPWVTNAMPRATIVVFSAGILARMTRYQVGVAALFEQDLRQNFTLVAQLRQQDRFVEALVCATRGLEQARAGLETRPVIHDAGGGHLSPFGRWISPDPGLPLNQLGVIHQGMGNYAEAIPVFVESLAIKRQALGREHPYIAISLDNLAMTYKHIGDFGAAESLSREALEIACQTLGADHPTTATILSNRATLCQETGDYRQAESLHRQALNIRRKVLGEQHPQVALSLDELALLYQKAGDYKAAEPFHQRATRDLAQRVRRWPP